MAISATWFTYKRHNTYLISITLQGTVSFVSKEYGGRVHMTKACGCLYQLQQRDVVLADRAFHVQKIVAFKGAILNIPAFTKGKAQLPAAERDANWPMCGSTLNV